VMVKIMCVKIPTVDMSSTTLSITILWLSKKTDLEYLMDLHASSPSEHDKVVLGMSPARTGVCMPKWLHTFYLYTVLMSLSFIGGCVVNMNIVNYSITLVPSNATPRMYNIQFILFC
jgi:hypothetical protein